MNDSHISVSRGGTCFSGDDAVRLFQATALRSGIKLMMVGIKPARGWTKRGALTTATMYTGKPYKVTQCAQAVADLTIWIENMKLAMPVIHHD
jgi:hypothetical protein